jgi:hypothetical protein
MQELMGRESSMYRERSKYDTVKRKNQVARCYHLCENVMKVMQQNYLLYINMHVGKYMGKDVEGQIPNSE